MKQLLHKPRRLVAARLAPPTEPPPVKFLHTAGPSASRRSQPLGLAHCFSGRRVAQPALSGKEWEFLVGDVMLVAGTVCLLVALFTASGPLALIGLGAFLVGLYLAIAGYFVK